VYDKLKRNFAGNELFDSFWSRKLVAEKDEADWQNFKTVIKGTLGQVSSIDRILNSLSIFHVLSGYNTANIRFYLLLRHCSG
jgi:hypothetical protein